jgi:hypothetical protein
VATKPVVPIKVSAPPASDPLPSSPNIFTPKPVLRQSPVALKASTNNPGVKTDAAKPKAAKRELPPALPVTGKAAAQSQGPAVPFATPRRYSLRRRVAIALGLAVAVAVTTWSAVRVMAAGHRGAPSVQVADPTSR